MNDASIKHKDVKTNNSGQYSTMDNISILNVMSLHTLPMPIFILYSIFYDNESNKTTVNCYLLLSYVDQNELNDYLDNNRNKEIKISAYSTLTGSINIRLYYI